MPEKQLREQLKHGDMSQICQLTGFSHEYVKLVLKGDRNQESKGGKQIVSIAKQIIQQREELKKQSA